MASPTPKRPRREFRFTKAAIVSLPAAAPDKRDYYFDTESRNLLVTVTDTGHKSFQFYRKVDGTPERITLGAFDPDMPDSQEFTKDRPLLERVQKKHPLNVKKARALADAVRHAINDGMSVEDIKRNIGAALTIEALLERFLKQRRNKRGQYLAKKTKLEYQALFNTHLTPLRKLNLAALTTKRVKDLHESIGKKAPYSANRCIAVLSSMYGFAIAHDLYRGENPAKGVCPFPEEHRRRFLHPDEMPRFFNALAEEPSDFKDAFLLALLTGARRTDVLSMQWAHVHLSRGIWEIPRTKNGSPLTVSLTGDAVALLRKRIPDKVEAEAFVFPGVGKSGHMVEPKGAWKRVLKRAGIENLRFHDLRHTVGSALAATGANMAIIMQALGHKTQRASLIYQEMHQDPIRRAMETATGAILESAGVESSAQSAKSETQA